MAYQQVTGDLLALGLPAIGHGCNLAGSMGGGIATQVRDRWPDLYAEYVELCSAGALPLGSFHAFDVGGMVVYNLATQVNPGADAQLDAIESAVEAALQDAGDRGISQLGVPRLGAGIGGLAWVDVESVLRRLADASTVELIVVTLPRRSSGS